MSIQIISTGTSPNDGTGDTLLSGATKVNENFQEIYDSFGDGSNLVVYWGGSVSGIYALSNVGIGTTNLTSKLTVRGGDISVGNNNDHGLVLTSPNGTAYRLIVNNDGTLSTTVLV